MGSWKTQHILICAYSINWDESLTLSFHLEKFKAFDLIECQPTNYETKTNKGPIVLPEKRLGNEISPC